MAQRILHRRERAVRTARPAGLARRPGPRRTTRCWLASGAGSRTWCSCPWRPTSSTPSATSWPSGFAARRFQDTAYIPYVEEALQLRGFDAAPVVTTTGVTFARVDGRWRIVSDDDVADREPDGSRNKPWDLTRIVVRRTPHALGIFDAASAPSAHRLMAWTEESVRTVRRRGAAERGPAGWCSTRCPARGCCGRWAPGSWTAPPSPSRCTTTPRPADPAGGDAGRDQPALPAPHGASGHLPAEPRAHARGPGPHQRRHARWVQEGSRTTSPPAGLPGLVAARRRPRSPGPARAPTRCPGSTFFGDARPGASSTTSRSPPARCSPTGSAPTGSGRSCERLSAAGFADGDAEAPTDRVLGRMFGLDSRRLARDAARLVVTRGS